MTNSKYVIDDKITIPDYLQKMSLDELENYISQLKTQDKPKKK